MNTMGKIVLCVLAVIFVLPSHSLDAEYFSDTRETLRGIKGILVVVKNHDRAANEHGFSRETIQKAVVSQLRESGIRIVPLKKFPTLNPYLFIEITTDGSQSDLHAYSLFVALKQLVFLGSKPEVSLDAITWSKMMTGTATGEQLGKAVQSSITDLVDIFLGDYLSVNPEQDGRSQSGKDPAPFLTVPGKGKTFIRDKTGEQWDISQAVLIGFKPEDFQYGMGRDAIQPLYSGFLGIDSSKAPPRLRVIGIAKDSDAQAYSVTRLTAHEIANGTIGSEPIAAAY